MTALLALAITGQLFRSSCPGGVCPQVQPAQAFYYTPPRVLVAPSQATPRTAPAQVPAPGGTAGTPAPAPAPNSVGSSGAGAPSKPEPDPYLPLILKLLEERKAEPKSEQEAKLPPIGEAAGSQSPPVEKDGCVNYGVNHEALGPGTPEAVTSSNDPESKAWAESVKSGPEGSYQAQLVNDSGWPTLVLAGSQRERRRILDALQADPELAELLESTKVLDYDPNDPHAWWLKREGITTHESSVLVYDSYGRCVLHQKGFTGGSKRVLRYLRRARGMHEGPAWLARLVSRAEEMALRDMVLPAIVVLGVLILVRQGSVKT